MSVHVPHLRFRPTPFMAEWIHKIAVREGRSQAERHEHFDSGSALCAVGAGTEGEAADRISA